MSKPIVFMFSGQGSQYFQMGKELYQQQPIFRHWLDAADEFAQKAFSFSFLTEMYNSNHKKTDPFTRLLYTHPAIFAFEYALAQSLIAHDIKPDYCLGSSLGEFCAAAIAEVISFEEALGIIIQQAQTIEKYCKPAGMLAILCDPKILTSEAFHNVELASHNFEKHFVISGADTTLQKINEIIGKDNIVTFKLPVNYGFHSTYIDEATESFLKSIENIPVQEARVPLISCSQAQLINLPNTDYFWEVIRQPILFLQTIQQLESTDQYIYIDAGPSGTLANFVKNILKPRSQSKTIAITTPFGTKFNNFTNLKNELT